MGKCIRVGCESDGIIIGKYGGACSLYCRDLHELDAELAAIIRERDEARDRLASLQHLLCEITEWAGWCPECGTLHTVDEDGNCPYCGALATGAAIDRIRAALDAKDEHGRGPYCTNSSAGAVYVVDLARAAIKLGANT